MVILKVKGLKVRVDEKEVLNGVNLTVGTREVHAVMGPNGSGKSTLAYTLAGHPRYEVTGGDVIWGRSSFLVLKPEERARKGLFLAFQNPVAVEGVKVIEFLWEVYRRIRLKRGLRTDARERIADFRSFREEVGEYCRSLGFAEEFMKRGLNEGFSGGERKKLEILQMLVLRPRVAILDETDSGTDVDGLGQVAAGIKTCMNVAGTSFVIISHHRNLFSHIKPDFVHIFVRGKIVATGDYKLAFDIEKEGYGKWTGEGDL